MITKWVRKTNKLTQKKKKNAPAKKLVTATKNTNVTAMNIAPVVKIAIAMQNINAVNPSLKEKG